MNQAIGTQTKYENKARGNAEKSAFRIIFPPFRSNLGRIGSDKAVGQTSARDLLSVFLKLLFRNQAIP
jgi:hypothetical protein